MRIVGGSLKGRSLAKPKTMAIRPTTDRTRESLFNVLQHSENVDWHGCRVLDLFAGTGALGIEALSRGAEFAMFFDVSTEGRGLLRQNIDAFQLTGCTKISRRDSTKPGAIGTLKPFNLVFADPPYGKGLGDAAISAAATNGWIADGAVIVLEESSEAAVSLPDAFELSNERRIGSSILRIYHYAI